MSRPPGSRRVERPLRTVARLSLVMVTMLPALVSGCFDPPPEYSKPGTIPPIVSGALVDPTPTRVVVITSQTQQIRFSIPFRSEDAGDDLQAVFWLDLDPIQDFSRWNLLGQVLVLADSHPLAEQTNRAVLWLWPFADRRPTSGCHTVTMVLSHKSNLPTVYNPIDPADVAEMTWFVDFQDGSTAAPGCPARPLSGGAP